MLRLDRGRAARGSSMVEAALVLTIVLITLIGIVDLGQVLMFHQGLVERVRAGARYAVVSDFDQTEIQNVVLFGTPRPPTGSKPLFLLKRDMVSADHLDVGLASERIEVRISNYPFRFFTPLVAGNYRAKPISASIPAESMGAAD